MAEEKRLTPIKAIRKYCLGCSNGSSNEVKLCPMTKCELYEYRFGHNPARKGMSGNIDYIRNARSTHDSEAEEDEVEEIID